MNPVQRISASITATHVPMSDQWRITKNGEHLGLATKRSSGAWALEGHAGIHPSLAAAALALAYDTAKPAADTETRDDLEAALADLANAYATLGRVATTKWDDDLAEAAVAINHARTLTQGALDRAL